MLAAYVSGHGFGHAVRTREVLRALRRARPDLPITVVTSAPREVAAGEGDGIEHRRLEVDVGLVQRGALEIDAAGTAEAWRAFQSGHRERVAGEARWLREREARLVLADIPPLAFTAAAEAGLPAVGLANFSWDWIYGHLARGTPALAPAAEDAARAYRAAALLLELPFAGDLSAFPRREAIPLVARRAPHEPSAVRRRLGLEGGETVVLVSFGGIGLPGLSMAPLGALGEFVFLTTDGSGAAASNVRPIDLAALRGEGFEYVDLVAAADVVVTKPGYGIVSDAIASRTRMVYTERGDFPEYPVLVGEMTRWLPAVHLSNALLHAGRWGPALEAVMALPFPDLPRMDGAEVAARRVLEEAARA